MVKAITSVTQAQPSTQAKAADQKTPQTKSQPAKTDTVQLSTAGLAAAQAKNTTETAYEEASETPAQTAKEARSGDMQAKRLLAKEQAEAGKV